MAQYTGTVPSPRSVEQNFDDLADFTTVSEWDPGIQSSELTAGERYAVGARYHVVQKTLGREIEIDYEVTEVDRPRRIVLRGENATVVSIDTITFEQEGAGSRVTYDAVIELKKGKLLDPAMNLFMQRIGKEAERGLVERVGASGGGGGDVGSRPADA